MSDKLKSERAGDRRRLDELHRDRIAEPVPHSAADKRAAGFVEAEILVADGAGRDKAVGAGLVELDKQAGTRDAGNVSIEGRADAVGQKMRD